MQENSTNPLKGDRALSGDDKDRLGFRKVARSIAISLVDQSTKEGLVIGLEGAWGSGKSSLLHLICAELEELPKNSRPRIVNFRPWLIGNRDALLKNLFAEILRQIELVALGEGDAGPITVAKAKEAAQLLKRLVKYIGTAGSMIEFLGDAGGSSYLAFVGKFISRAKELTDEEKIPPSLFDLKSKLAKSLAELDCRFIVTIDDVDRLEPDEVIEILRLVKSVVDLPNILYLLCYDSSIIAKSIESALGIENGNSYLEKIVQLTVMTPAPETFQLRQWFADELDLIASTRDDDELSRLKQVIDLEGGYRLTTPRAVVRTLDAVRFYWPPLKELRVDLADLVWILIIKDSNPQLYRWIEDYCASVAAISLGTGKLSAADKEN